MSKPPFQVKSLYEYSSPHEDDLSFPNGQIITVTDEEDDDWYYGEFEDAKGKKQEGLFPRNFVKIFEPETPPRPSRSGRAKKSSVDHGESSTQEPQKPAEESSEVAIDSRSIPAAKDEYGKTKETDSEVTNSATIAPTSATTSIPPATTSKPQAPPAQTAFSSAKPAPSASSKPAPPPTADKPASSSFKDRINAFNKPAAPPVAPAKPGGLSSSGGTGFIKKPFVAPPPSKNAYVPPPQAPAPQKIYRREDDPEMVVSGSADTQSEDRGAPSIPEAPPEGEPEDQPKPTSLKDRIALLQKQQMEQAARHAEKKEKSKRQSKRPDAEQSQLEQEEFEEEPIERVASSEAPGKKSTESSRDIPSSGQRSTAKTRRSQDDHPVGAPPVVPPRELLSDTNDADQSGGGDTEEGEELSPGQDDRSEKPKRQSSLPQQDPSPRSNLQEDNEDESEEVEDEEEDIDPEVKKKMELRERMAKMSGGMGMAGMFGPPGGLPPRATPKQGSSSSHRKASGGEPSSSETRASHAPPVPMVPMPGLTKFKSPDQVDDQSPDQQQRGMLTAEPGSITQNRRSEEVIDEEDSKGKSVPSRSSTDRAPPPPPPQTRPLPPAPQARAPPDLPSERPVPPPPTNSRPLPPPPGQPLSQSEGSQSDDELSAHAKGLSIDQSLAEDSDPPTPSDTPQPPSINPVTSIPSRPKVPESRPSDIGAEDAQSSPSTPTESIPEDPLRKDGRPPPVPGTAPAIPSAPQGRAPPPPPPPSTAPAPPSRSSTTNSRAPPPIPKAQTSDDEEEITEYDGDYDTDMASSAPRKDALKGHARAPSLEDDSMAEEASLHHSGLPSIGPPPPTTAPRAVPPPPPSQPPKQPRQSSDMPRAPPPPPPSVPKERVPNQAEGEYDPYKYTGEYRMPSSSRVPTTGTPKIEEPEQIYPTSPSQQMSSPSQPAVQAYQTSPNMSVPGVSGSRQSSDMQRTSTTIRRSAEGSRQSGEQGLIASDVDLSPSSRWWTQPGAPPPVFQNRRDVLFETEETSTTKRGGKQTTTRTVYVLFMDYSQTVVTAHFESRDPSTATLEQAHENPPRSLRQDQLEDTHVNFGAHIAKGANTRKETVVGDGSPHSLPFELISSLPNALLPVGVRAYGALVYSNLANASILQFDQIRPGDIVTFRNAKFQGHRGTMHAKYTIEVGKPDHVGIVLEWDGTKKKVRAWEQGRESKKVKPESFKFGDLRSGEVKVWRVMPRSWVGWEGQN